MCRTAPPVWRNIAEAQIPTLHGKALCVTTRPWRACAELRGTRAGVKAPIHTARERKFQFRVGLIISNSYNVAHENLPSPIFAYNRDTAAHYGHAYIIFNGATLSLHCGVVCNGPEISSTYRNGKRTTNMTSKYSVAMRLRRILSSGWHKFIVGREKLRTVVRDGAKYQVPYIGRIAKDIIDNRPYEVAQWSFLRDQVQQGGHELFIDIGAHFGIYSLRMALAGLVDKVYAIEGSRQIFPMLKNHIEINNLSKHIVPFNEVAHAKDEIIMYYDSHINALSGWSGTENSLPSMAVNLNQVGQSHKARGIPLDKLFTFRNEKLVLKIDVEGHELNVLNGAIKLLTLNNVLLQIEILPRNAANVNWLFRNGFELVNRIDSDFYFINHVSTDSVRKAQHLH